jgi:hypothetical protein
MRWPRWVVLALVIAAGCCLAVAAAQWYVRNYGVDDLVCRGRQPPTGLLRDCLDNRPDPLPAALVGAVLAASALLVWLRARRPPASACSGRASPSGT